MSGVSLGRGCIRKGTIMHEILHVLGFWHEQSRPDRDSYVTIHWDNIQKSHSYNFNKMTTSQVDYGSVMHYGAYSFAIDRRKPTIEPKQRGVTIGQRVRLSDIDIEKVQILYGCKSGHSGTLSPHATAATAAPVVTNPQPASTDSCNFNQNFCHWTNVHGTDNVDWARHHGSTPSANTGPHVDHLGSSSGYYAYIEASGHYNSKAVLKSKDFSEGSYCISLYYHMYGADMGTLKIYLVANGSRRLTHTISGDHGDRWVHYLMNLRVTHSTFHLELEGQTGRSYHSDIAIDDLSVTSGSCHIGKRDVSEFEF